MPSYKELYEKEKRKSKYAWACYYREMNNQFENNLFQLDTIKEIVFVDNPNAKIEGHLENYISSLYEKAKEKVECCICLEPITKDTLHIQGCGHLLHKDCYNNLAKHSTTTIKCPLCRQ